MHTSQDILVSVIRSGFRDATDRRSFDARVIFRHRTLQPWWSQCGLWFQIKSARAVNVAFLFLFERYVARAFFSCFQTTDEERVPSKRLALI